MDDLVHGCSTKKEGREVVDDVCEILENGGFRMRNWISNKAAVLAGVPDRVKNLSSAKEFGEQWQRVLGIQWDPTTDDISFQMDITWTKRGVLSQLEKLFDPCGLLSPFLVTGKTLMQQLWKKEQDGNQELDEEDKAKWQRWLGQWALLEELHIPKYVQAEVSEEKTSMAAVVYLRSVANEEIKVFLLASKTQVAPMKVQTIPRLELQACLMAANLDEFVQKQINMGVISTTFWTGSAILALG